MDQHVGVGDAARVAEEPVERPVDGLRVDEAQRVRVLWDGRQRLIAAQHRAVSRRDARTGH